MRFPTGLCPDNIRVMKLFLISINMLVILSILPFSVQADPRQEFKITLQANRAALSEVFNEIRRQTGFVVFYSNDLFNDQEKINVNFIEAGLDDVMRNLLRGRSLGYKIRENFIIIIKAVVITTKNGTAGRLSVNYTGNYSTRFKPVYNDFNIMNTDWFDVLFRNSFVQEHSLSISSGSEKPTSYFSTSYYGDNGWTIADKVSRLRSTIAITIH